jgi:TM2 domain-containing membrane protein YozV
MAKFCPDCGKSVENESSKFCNNCGASLNSSIEQKEAIQKVPEEKDPIGALICSIIIPGLGQVYNGEFGKGIVIFLGTLIGLFIFIIPGLIVWIYGVYNAHSTAEKMNKKEIPFKATKTAHVVIFIVLAIFIIIIAVALVFVAMIGYMFQHLYNLI